MTSLFPLLFFYDKLIRHSIIFNHSLFSDKFYIMQKDGLKALIYGGTGAIGAVFFK